MSETNWIELVNTLKQHGLIFEKGLTDRQVEHIQQAASFRFPPDLKAFLKTAVPIALESETGDRKSSRSRFPNWHEDPKQIMDTAWDWTLKGFEFDVKECGFWYTKWGKRPENLADALETMERNLSQVPRLIPLFIHRHLPSVPEQAGNPVISMYQAVDTIYYGYNLENYLRHEFLGVEEWGKASDYRQVPFWSDIVLGTDIEIVKPDNNPSAK